jgi:streptogramin lyase
MRARRLIGAFCALCVVASLGSPAGARAAGATLSWFPVPQGDEYSISLFSGPDGSVWYADGGVGRVGPSGLTPVAGESLGAPPLEGGEAVSAAGAVWELRAQTGILRVSAAGAVTGFPLRFPPATYAGEDQATGLAYADGKLWVTLAGPHILRVGLHGGEQVLPDAEGVTETSDPTPGLDGDMWFVAQDGGHEHPSTGTRAEPTSIGRITPAGITSVWQVASDGAPIGGLTAGSEGVWFTVGSDRVGRLTYGGRLTVFRRGIPSDAFYPPTNLPHRDIVRGPDGAIWFLEPGAKALGRIDARGAVTQVRWSGPPAGDAQASEDTIVAGPQQTLWFTAMGEVARLSVRRRCSVPAIVGRPLSEARALLRQAGCRLGPISGTSAARAVVVDQGAGAASLLPYAAAVGVRLAYPATARRMCLPKQGEVVVAGDSQAVITVRRRAGENFSSSVYSDCRVGSGVTRAILKGGYSSGAGSTNWSRSFDFALAGHFLAVAERWAAADAYSGFGVKRIDLDTGTVTTALECEAEVSCPTTEGIVRVAVDGAGDLAWQARTKASALEFFGAATEQIHAFVKDRDVLLDVGPFNAFLGPLAFTSTGRLGWRHQGRAQGYAYPSRRNRRAT